MKKLLTICLLLATSFNVNAQQKPTFEETLEYINAMFKENDIHLYPSNSKTGYAVQYILVEHSGKTIAYNKYKNGVKVTTLDIICSFNLFDIDSFEYSFNSNGFYLNTKKEDQYVASFRGLSAPDAGKLEKALTHLRTLCVKTADPFGE
jgi:hypothetical protein